MFSRSFPDSVRIYISCSYLSLLFVVFQTLSYFIFIEDVKAGSKSSMLMMDPQKKLNLVDESFIDQKDVLLDMVRYQMLIFIILVCLVLLTSFVVCDEKVYTMSKS